MARTLRYLDSELTTGKNDGTSWSNAWRSFGDAAAGVAAGNEVIMTNSGKDETLTANVTLATSATGTAPIIWRPKDGETYAINGNGYRVIITGHAQSFHGIHFYSSITSNNGVVQCDTANPIAFYGCKFRQINTSGYSGNSVDAYADAKATFVGCYFENGHTGSSAKNVYCTSSHFERCQFKAVSGVNLDWYGLDAALTVSHCLFYANGVSSQIYLEAMIGDPYGCHIANNSFGGSSTYDLHFQFMPFIGSNNAHYVITRNIFASGVTYNIYNGDVLGNTGPFYAYENAVDGTLASSIGGFGDWYYHPGEVVLAGDPFIDASDFDFRLNSGHGALCRNVLHGSYGLLNNNLYSDLGADLNPVGTAQLVNGSGLVR